MVKDIPFIMRIFSFSQSSANLARK